VDVLLEQTLYRPFKMLIHEPTLVLVTFYMSVVYAVLYACRSPLPCFPNIRFTKKKTQVFEAFPVIFIDHHGLSTSQCGLIFLGVGIGTTIGAVSNLWIGARLGYNALIKEWRGFPPPELRLYGAATGGPLLVIGCFWLGWTGAYNDVPWYVPALSTIPIGAAISLIFISFLVCSCTVPCRSVLITACILELRGGHISVSFCSRANLASADSCVARMFAASAFSVNTMIRSAVAAAFPLFTAQMYTNVGLIIVLLTRSLRPDAMRMQMGIQWAGTLIGLIAAVLAPIPFLFLKYGVRIRTRSLFAPCMVSACLTRPAFTHI
jgi:MFS transporter, DHA1 family, multidrug resistance protein